MEPNHTDHPRAPLAVTGVGLVPALGVGQEERPASRCCRRSALVAGRA